MFFRKALLLASLMSLSPGGWETISIESEQMKFIKPYLDRNLPRLFPEIQLKGYSIVSAQMQVVDGINYQLTIKSTNALCFELTLFVDQQNKINIISINRPSEIEPSVGSYKWLNPMIFGANDYDRLVRTIQKRVNLVVSKKGTVLSYRKQIVNGVKEHIIFRDTNQNVFSAIIIRRPYSLTDKLISVYLIH